MDKLGKVWTKLSTSRRSSQTRPTKEIDVDDDAPTDTKKVFEMFAETSRSMEHRYSNVVSGSARPASAYRKHQSLTGRETIIRAPKQSEPIALEAEGCQRTPPAQVPAPGSSATAVTANILPSLTEVAGTNISSSAPVSKTYRVIPVVAIDTEPDGIEQLLGTDGITSLPTVPRTSRPPTPNSTAGPLSTVLKNRNNMAAVPPGSVAASSRIIFTLPSPALPETMDKAEDDADRQSQDSIGRERTPELSTTYDILHEIRGDFREASKKNDDFMSNAASSNSAIDFKQQSKRRSSMFVRRGSVTMEPLKRIVLDDVYHVYKELGSGRFGFIKLAEHKESKHNIAIKFFPRPQTKQIDFIREYNYSYFLSPHPNIIDTYQGAYQTDDENAYFFVQEFCPCASLREAVEASSSGIGENATKIVMLKVLAAVEFMHNENLVHRNLKAENILIFDKEYNKVKVTDFGLTRKVGSSVRNLEFVNSYHAPELCETVVNETLVVDRSIDIWAIGILIYYCLKGRFPWQKATIMCKPYWEWEQWLKRKNLQLPKRWDSFSEKSLKLFRRTLEARYKERWGVKNISKCLMKEKLLKTPKVAEEV